MKKILIMFLILISTNGCFNKESNVKSYDVDPSFKEEENIKNELDDEFNKIYYKDDYEYIYTKIRLDDTYTEYAEIICKDKNTKETIWNYKTDKFYVAQYASINISFTNNGIIIIEGNNIISLKYKDGKLMWANKLDNSIGSEILKIDNKLIFYFNAIPAPTNITVIDLNTGKLIKNIENEKVTGIESIDKVNNNEIKVTYIILNDENEEDYIEYIKLNN